MGKFIFTWLVLLEFVFAAFLALNQYVVRIPVAEELSKQLNETAIQAEATSYIPLMRQDDLVSLFITELGRNSYNTSIQPFAP